MSFAKQVSYSLSVIICEPQTEACTSNTCKTCPVFDFEHVRDWQLIFCKWAKGETMKSLYWNSQEQKLQIVN